MSLLFPTEEVVIESGLSHARFANATQLHLLLLQAIVRYYHTCYTTCYSCNELELACACRVRTIQFQ